MFDLFRRRDKAVRYLLGGVLVMIAFSMVVTLIPGFGSSSATDDRNDTVAKIGDDKVTVRDAVVSIQNVMRRQNVPPSAVKSLVDNFLDSMISSRVMALQAGKMGLALSDKDLAETIRSRVPQLFPNGQFMGRQAYEAFLAQNGMNVAEFELNVRRSIAIERMGKMIEDSVVVTDKELTTEYRSANEKAKIEYISLSEDAYRNLIQLTDADLKTAYDKEPTAYNHPVRTSYTLVVCNQDCFDADNVLAPDGNYGIVQEGRIAVTNEAGTVEFGTDEAFYVADINTVAKPLLGRPGFLRDAWSAIM